MTRRELPEEFLAQVRALEPAYLAEKDPILQSGFHGGPVRWRAERGPILDAIERDGDLLDVGCAVGHLLDCLVRWGAERGLRIEPFGLDLNPRLLREAIRRTGAPKEHFFLANAWDWQPPRRFDFVYALIDCVPPDFEAELAAQLLDRALFPGGRLIVGDYGSRSQNRPPRPLAELFAGYGFEIAGSAPGGDPPITAFAWIDAPSAPAPPRR